MPNLKLEVVPLDVAILVGGCRVVMALGIMPFPIKVARAWKTSLLKQGLENPKKVIRNWRRVSSLPTPTASGCGDGGITRSESEERQKMNGAS